MQGTHSCVFINNFNMYWWKHPLEQSHKKPFPTSAVSSKRQPLTRGIYFKRGWCSLGSGVYFVFVFTKVNRTELFHHLQCHVTADAFGIMLRDGGFQRNTSYNHCPRSKSTWGVGTAKTVLVSVSCEDNKGCQERTANRMKREDPLRHVGLTMSAYIWVKVSKGVGEVLSVKTLEVEQLWIWIECRMRPYRNIWQRVNWGPEVYRAGERRSQD